MRIENTYPVTEVDARRSQRYLRVLKWLPLCQSPTNGASLLQAAYERDEGVNGSWPNRAISSLTKLLVYGDDFQTPIFISHAAGYTGKL